MAVDIKRDYEIRSILHEMREEYWQGLTEADELQEELLECVTFAIGGEIYAFETVFAAEVLRIPRLIRVPGVQETIAGVFNLRGEITAAMDIRPLLGLPAPPFSKRGRIIVVRSEKFVTGILVEAVEEVKGLSYKTFEPVVKTRHEIGQQFIRGQFNQDGALTVLLDITRLLAAPEIMVGTVS